MNKSSTFPFILAASLGIFIASASAEVTLPALISNHAVLQRSDHTRVWGKAAPGEKVTVSLGGVRAQATTGADGKWQVILDLSKVAEGPFELTVEGVNRVVVSDVLIGELWVCSGQSNMAFGLARAGEAAQEIPQSANPKLRQFRVANSASATPEDNCKGAWIAARPDTAKEFTAVGYFFGKRLQATIQQPVGLILAAWSGTSAMSWLPPEALASVPEWQSKLASVKKRVDDYPLLKEQYLPAYRQWETQFQRNDHPAEPAAYAAPGVPLGDWKKVTLPATLPAAGLPDSGAVWFRKQVNIPPGSLENAMIQLGAVRDFNALYLNGKKFDETTVESLKGGFDVRYALPKGALHEGENTVAIRLFTPTERAAMPSTLFIGVGTARVLLNGEWLAKVEFALPALTAEARKALPMIPPNPGTHSVPGRIFNGMIHPLLAATIQGVIWYQGEQDTGQPALYWKMFEGIIRGWRTGWGRELPFYFCQLPNYSAKKDLPENSLWAQLREAQAKGLTLPHTGQAVLIDLGEEDVHPIYKQEAGERLARLALARTYQQTVVDSGPVFQAMKIEGDKVRLTFGGTAGGLVAKPLPAQYQPTSMSPALQPLVRHSPDGELEGFALCGADKNWKWATARIEGETVVLWSPAVPQPVAVRYAWANNPTCNLYNGAGLPAAPFQAGTER
ncbi:MAG: sialate O-acetylesterase [Verrucomicrobiota bacterium]